MSSFINLTKSTKPVVPDFNRVVVPVFPFKKHMACRSISRYDSAYMIILISKYGMDFYYFGCWENKILQYKKITKIKNGFHV
jgi:hypothetical protein